VNQSLKEKLKDLPNKPGVYLHLDKNNEVIYVGKAAVLKNRVRQYFQKIDDLDTKTKALVREINMTNWIETESEIDALFLESELVKRYKPKFNVLLRDDKSQLYVRIDMKSDWPTINFTRNPLDDSASYFGPYFNGYAVKKALRYLRRIFPYYIKTPKVGLKPDLYSHLGLSPSGDTSSKDYKASLRQLINCLEGKRHNVALDLEKKMKIAAKNQDFETAAKIRNQINNLGQLSQRIMFGDIELSTINNDEALRDLKELLGLEKLPVCIEGFDISHMGGRDVVASMVVFRNGVSDRSSYRKFKAFHQINNDFLNMQETIKRRFSEKNLKTWGIPNLILIDGGKGQLEAASSAMTERNQAIGMIGLAKKNEQIIINNKNLTIKLNTKFILEKNGTFTSTDGFTIINLPKSSHIIKLLQRIRDESHRFAVSYHTTVKRKRQTSSILLDIPGIGPRTQKKLLKNFGSIDGIRKADLDSLELIIGKKTAVVVKNYLN